MAKQIVLGMVWNYEGHEFRVTKMFKNGKVQITETWISEDTRQECKHVANYNVSEDENGQFAWQDKYKEYAFDENEDSGYRWWARMYAVGADFIPNEEDETKQEMFTTNPITGETFYHGFNDTTTNKEEEEMKGQATNLTIEVSGQIFTMTRPGYYYGKVDGKQKRISKDEWEAAYEIWNRGKKQEESDKATEKAVNKPKKKNAFFTSPSTGMTLTEKQVSFLLEIPKDDFFEHGLDSALWIDCLCDTIAEKFNPMAVGAMVSTLKEKNLIVVATDRVNGKICKFFEFTEVGKQVAKEVGLE